MKVPQSSGLSQEEWDRIWNPMERLAKTKEWKEYARLSKEVRSLEYAFAKKNFSFTKWKSPDWIQDRRHHRIVKRLEQVLADTNNALRHQRDIHGASPMPSYFLPEIDSEYIFAVRIEHHYLENGIPHSGVVPVRQLETIIPSKRDRILIVPYDNNHETYRPLCGFCGVTEEEAAAKKGSRIYRTAGMMGLGSRVYFCEKDSAKPWLPQIISGKEPLKQNFIHL